MNIENEKDDETQSIDMEAATAEISSELFPEDNDDGKSGTEGAEKASGAENVEAAPPQSGDEKAVEKPAGEEKPVEGETSTEVQETGAPKTWTKEALADWATIPPRAQAEILKREEDFHKGISMYKSAAELGQRYDTVVEPFRAVLAAEKIDPVDLFNSFASNHYLLSRGTPEQKIQLAANLINGYQIDFGQLAEFIGDRVINPVDPEIAALRKEVADLKGGFTAQTSRERDVALAARRSEIDAFAADPAHPYFDELASDITGFLESGLAPDLKTAYEKAVYANPTTRQKEIDRLAAEKIAADAAAEKERKDKQAKSQGDHVKTSQTSRNGTVPLGSMDDTLEATMRSITERT